MFCSTYVTNAQKVPVKFGKIDPSEFSKNQEQFPEAEAIVLADFGSTEFVYANDKGWQYRFDRVVRIKILSKEGYDYANISIPFYEGSGGSKEKIAGLKGATYNLVDGKIEKEKLKNDAVFEEQLSENWYQQKFTFPNVKEGSIIEYEYSILSDYIYNLQSWSFQSTIPVEYSEYRLRVPEYFYYQQVYQGFEPLTIRETDSREETFTIKYTTIPQRGGTVENREATLKSNSKIYRWAAENLPAIKREPYMTTASDYFTKIEFQLVSIRYPNEPVEVVMGSYEDKFTKSFLESDRFGKLLTRTGFAEEIIAGLTGSVSSEYDKMVQIYEHVKSKMEWNDQYRLFASSNLKSIYKDQKGSVADINLLLVAMLNESGITAHPVVLSTRSNGKPHPVYPNMSKFNYVIAAAIIDNEYYLLDATQKGLPANTLPEKALNGSGWLLSQNPHWINLNANTNFSSTNMVSMNISEEGSLQAVLQSRKGSLLSAKARAKYLQETGQNYLKENYGNMTDWQVISSEFNGDKDIYESFTEKVELVNEEIELADILYIDPFLFSSINENVFKNETRRFPVDLPAPIQEQYIFTFDIPEGYTVAELPQSQVFGLPNNDASFRFSASVLGSKINIAGTVLIRKTFFSPEEYASLRKFYELVVAKYDEQVVLKKI
ncbi:DUF3857 domain-containing protein [Fulvivirga ulvae]|uniref:DUF3857 domain-containing protein n=1 Tax=Fulvivirga ulvae TaxID=2904245 RepID=UPI001F403CA4|nr:DUF3857 domain-containing protein [Fulvivirga ulvae]UII33884.1 DUF3857 domain-containing protein [Fulvivirga ulvae]